MVYASLIWVRVHRELEGNCELAEERFAYIGHGVFLKHEGDLNGRKQLHAVKTRHVTKCYICRISKFCKQKGGGML
jgi:hypothetical protein